MKAIICPKYGGPEVLRLEDVPQPAPKDDEVLIEVHAASLNAADWHLMRGEPLAIRASFGLRKPKQPILGADVAGRVQAVGSAVKGLQPGDEVFGDLSASDFGAFAQYVCAPEGAIVRKPPSLTFEQAAAVPLAAVTALQGLRDKGQLRPGQKLLITGASGGVGTFAVQLAKHYGAEVTGVSRTEKMDAVRSLGADEVIDHTREDFTTSREGYFDLIFDAGAFRPVSETIRALRSGGTYVMVGGATGPMFQAILLGPWLSWRSGKQIVSFLAKPNRADLETVRELVESGKLKPVIDRVFPLSETAQAIQRLEEGQATGKVVISMDELGDLTVEGEQRVRSG